MNVKKHLKEQADDDVVTHMKSANEKKPNLIEGKAARTNQGDSSRTNMDDYENKDDNEDPKEQEPIEEDEDKEPIDGRGDGNVTMRRQLLRSGKSLGQAFDHEVLQYDENKAQLWKLLRQRKCVQYLYHELKVGSLEDENVRLIDETV